MRNARTSAVNVPALIRNPARSADCNRIQRVLNASEPSILRRMIGNPIPSSPSRSNPADMPKLIATSPDFTIFHDGPSAHATPPITTRATSAEHRSKTTDAAACAFCEGFLRQI